MAIYHADLKIFARRLGHSVVAAAAYRVGGVIVDDRTGVTHDYSVRTGVAFFLTLLPTGAPESLRDEPMLWNAVEAAEKRVDARVARELIVALPMELNEEQRHSLAVELGQMLVDRYAVALTLAVHTPDAKGDDRNHHVHLLFSTRTLGPDGFGAKTRVLDDKVTGPEEVKAIRESVALLTNRALQLAGCEARVDHRSLDSQAEEAASRGDVEAVFRLSRVPTKHEGKAATAGKRRGQRMDRVVANEERRIACLSNEAATTSVAHAVPAMMHPRHFSPGDGGQRRGNLIQSEIIGKVVTSDGARRARALRLRLDVTPRARRPNRTPTSVYLDALREAERASGEIARAYIARLRLEGEEAAALLQCARADARFALLLWHASCAHADSLTVAKRGDAANPGIGPTARRSRPVVGHPHRRAEAWERHRRKVLPLKSDSMRFAQASKTPLQSLGGWPPPTRGSTPRL